MKGVGLYNSSSNCEVYREKIGDYFIKDDMKEFDVNTLPNPFDKPDLVVFHSMYLVEHIFIAKKLKKYNIPYIIVPRGALTLKAQRKKCLKKKIANIILFKKYVREANAIHFLTQNEYQESKNFKFKDYIICGNGTTKKEKTKKYNTTNSDKFIITFIGRIERYHKGLDILLDAVNLGKEDFRKYKIIIELYGPDDNNSIRFLQEKIKKYDILDLIHINEPVYDKEKENVLLNTDLFIHTSRLEGHPTSIIEAISYGIPVLVTPGTNVAKEVEENKLGFVTQLNSKDIKDKIIFAYMNKNNFEKITENEIKFSNENFEWNSIMKDTIEKYKKIIESEKK